MTLTKPKSSLRDVPTIEEQAAEHGWSASLVDFGKAMREGTDYFNCSLLRRPDGLWLIVRRAKFSETEKLGMNDLMAFSLKDGVPQMGYKIQLDQRFSIEHFEDPRAVFHNGKSYIWCCNFIRNTKGCCYPHQMLSEVDGDWKSIRRYDPVYGHNGNDTAKNKLWEKNWVPFFHDGQPHFIYESRPHTVVRMDGNFNFREDYKTEIPFVWNHGHIRGGTPPILHDGKYFTFFHSSTDVPKFRRQYHTGCYAFEAKSPFRVIGMTDEPLLSGSRFDPWSPPKPLVTFPLGSDLQHGKWLISMGVNDIACGLLEVTHSDILERMIWAE